MISFVLAAAVSAPSLGIDPKACVPLAPIAADHAPGSCHVRVAANGMLLPDPKCTPGAINPTLTVKVLRDPRFRTDMVRDKLTSPAAKNRVYAWYGIAQPRNNTGQNQVCEKDHAIDLGSGGGDCLANIFPQCEPGLSHAKPVGQRQFKIKDANAEHQMIAALKAGETDAQLLEQQKRIAADWTALNKKVSDYVNGVPK